MKQKTPPKPAFLWTPPKKAIGIDAFDDDDLFWVMVGTCEDFIRGKPPHWSPRNILEAIALLDSYALAYNDATGGQDLRDFLFEQNPDLVGVAPELFSDGHGEMIWRYLTIPMEVWSRDGRTAYPHKRSQTRWEMRNYTEKQRAALSEVKNWIPLFPLDVENYCVETTDGWKIS